MTIKVKKKRKLQGLLVLSSRAPSVHYLVHDRLDDLAWKPDVIYMPPYRETGFSAMCIARYWAEKHNIPVLTRPAQLLRNVKRAIIFDAKTFAKTSKRLQAAGIKVVEHNQLYPFKHATWSLDMPPTAIRQTQEELDKKFLAEHVGISQDAAVDVAIDEIQKLRDKKVADVLASRAAEEQLLTRQNYARMDAKKLRDRLRSLVKRFEKAGWDPKEAREEVATRYPDGRLPGPAPLPVGAQCKDLDFTPEALKPLARGPVKKSKAQKKGKSPEPSNFYASLPPGPNLPARITAALDEAWERGYYEGLRVIVKLGTNELEKNGQKP